MPPSRGFFESKKKINLKERKAVLSFVAIWCLKEQSSLCRVFQSLLLVYPFSFMILGQKPH